MMTLTEKLDFSAVSLIYANFLLSRRVATIANTTNNPNIATATGDNFVHNVTCTTFQNSIRSSDNYLIVLCQEELKCVSILGIQQRITALENDGEWLEALALGLDHYESTVESQEDRKCDPDSNQMRKAAQEYHHHSLRISEDEEWLAELLLRYLNLAMDNAPSNSSIQQQPNCLLGVKISHPPPRLN